LIFVVQFRRFNTTRTAPPLVPDELVKRNWSPEIENGRFCVTSRLCKIIQSKTTGTLRECSAYFGNELAEDFSGESVAAVVVLAFSPPIFGM
jgi:hypothetical protein